jgi:hypothetical protein
LTTVDIEEHSVSRKAVAKKRIFAIALANIQRLGSIPDVFGAPPKRHPNTSGRLDEDKRE